MDISRAGRENRLFWLGPLPMRAFEVTSNTWLAGMEMEYYLDAVAWSVWLAYFGKMQSSGNNSLST